MRRIAALLTVLALAGLPPAALAQGGGGAFGPLPPASTPTPEPTEAPDADGDTVSRGFLLAIAGGVALIFVLIGLYITRDARRNLTEADRRAVDRQREGTAGLPGERKTTQTQKKKARQKGRAQRQARKTQRRR